MATETPIWYYARNGQRMGPVGLEEMRKLAGERELLGGDLVWREGLADWVAAGSVSELAIPTASAVPPPPPARAAHAPQAAAPYGYAQPAPVRRCAPFDPASRGKRIFLIVASGIAVISLFLPLFVISSNFGSGVAWGFSAWWSVMTFVLGLFGLAAAIVDLAMQTFPLVRQITRWIHWPVYALMILFLAVGLAYTYESGGGYFAGSGVILVPISPILVMGVAIAALVVGIKLCTTERPV